jgi:hypothetical protein
VTAPTPQPVLIVSATDPQQHGALQTWLSSQNWAATKWIKPRDVDELDAAVQRGTPAVVFTSWPLYLDALWDNHIHPVDWQVPLHVDPAGPPPSPRDFVALHNTWQHTRRRIRLTAALILSAIAIAAATTILLLAGI